MKPDHAALALAFVLILVACGDEADPQGSVGAPPAATPQQILEDPEAENPDRDRWVDLASRPMNPDWVGGTLIVGLQSPPATLNNLLWTASSDRAYFEHFLCPFLLEAHPDRVDGGFALEPVVAAAMPVRSDDGLAWTWTLREGLTWEDGQPLTAADYEFTWDLMQREDVRCDRRRSSLPKVESVKAVDDLTFVVRYKEPYYRAVANFGLEFTVVPRHEVSGGNLNERRRHVCYGPYRILHDEPERVVLTLRDEYRKKPHPTGPRYVENVEFRFVRERKSLVEQLRRGQMDITILPRDGFHGLAANATFRRHAWRTWYYLPGYDFIAWNTRDPADLDRPHPLFGDAAVRRAMSHLLDRDAIIAKLFSGFGKKVSGPFFFMEGDYDDTVPLISYDPARARELLATAGWKMGNKGILEKDGHPFAFTCLVLPRRPYWQGPLEFMAEEARKLGIAMNVEVTTGRAFNKAMENRNFDAFMVRMGLRPPVEPDVTEFFQSSFARVGSNWTGVSDPRMDSLLAKSQSAFDDAQRRSIRRQVHALFDEIHPFTVAWSTPSCVGINRRWANLKVHDLGIQYRDLVLRELWNK